MSTIKSRIAFVCLWLAVLPVWAQVPDTVFLEQLTWTEVRDALKGREDHDPFADGWNGTKRAAYGAGQAQLHYQVHIRANCASAR